MGHSLDWSRWALLAAFASACGSSRAESGDDDGMAGRMTASGGSPASGASGAAGAAATPTGGSSAAGAAGTPTSGAGGNPTAGSGGNSTGGAGGSPLAGEAGESSSGGAAGAGASSAGTGAEGGAPDDGLEPVSVIRGAAGEYWDLTIRGVDLEAYDGRRVLVRLGDPDRSPERLGSGEALIQSGAFELVFPAVWEEGLYKTKLVLIDVDDDRACDLSVDRLYRDARGAPAEVLLVAPDRDPGGNYFTVADADSRDRYCNDWFNRAWPLE